MKLHSSAIQSHIQKLSTMQTIFSTAEVANALHVGQKAARQILQALHDLGHVAPVATADCWRLKRKPNELDRRLAQAAPVDVLRAFNPKLPES